METKEIDKKIKKIIKEAKKRVRNMDKTDLEMWNEMTEKEKAGAKYLTIDMRPHRDLPIKMQCKTIIEALKVGLVTGIRNDTKQCFELIGDAIIMLNDIIEKEEKIEKKSQNKIRNVQKEIWVLTYLGDGGYPKDYLERWKFFSSLESLKKYVKKEMWLNYNYLSLKDPFEKHKKFKDEDKNFESFFGELGEGHKDIFSYSYHRIKLDEGIE